MDENLSPDFIRRKSNLAARIRRYNAKQVLTATDKSSPLFSSHLRSVKSELDLKRVESSFERVKAGLRSRSKFVLARNSREDLETRVRILDRAAEKVVTANRDRGLAAWQRAERAKGLSGRPVLKGDEMPIRLSRTDYSKLGRAVLERRVDSRLSLLREPNKLDRLFRDNLIQAIITAQGGTDESGLAEFIRDYVTVDEVTYLYRARDFDIRLFYSNVINPYEMEDVLDGIVHETGSGALWRSEGFEARYNAWASSFPWRDNSNRLRLLEQGRKNVIRDALS